jgi:hypothetical protein
VRRRPPTGLAARAAGPGGRARLTRRRARRGSAASSEKGGIGGPGMACRSAREPVRPPDSNG